MKKNTMLPVAFLVNALGAVRNSYISDITIIHTHPNLWV